MESTETFIEFFFLTFSFTLWCVVYAQACVGAYMRVCEKAPVCVRAWRDQRWANSCLLSQPPTLNRVHHANRLPYFSDLRYCCVNLLLKAFMENCLSCLPSFPQLASFNIYIIVAFPVFPQFLFTVMTFIHFRVSLAITGGHGFWLFQAAAGFFFVCFCGVISRQSLI